MVLIILIVLVVGTVAAVIKGQVDSAVEAGRGNKALTQLEAYYEAEDYDAMREYCRKMICTVMNTTSTGKSWMRTETSATARKTSKTMRNTETGIFGQLYGTDLDLRHNGL